LSSEWQVFNFKKDDELDEQYLVVAQKLFAIPWKEVAIIALKEQKSGLSEHGKPLFLCSSERSEITEFRE
jgi:hypothetical protein